MADPRLRLAGVLSAILNRVGLLPLALGGWSGVTFWYYSSLPLKFGGRSVTSSVWSGSCAGRCMSSSSASSSVRLLPETFGQALSAGGHKQVVRAGFLNLHSFFTTKKQAGVFRWAWLRGAPCPFYPQRRAARSTPASALRRLWGRSSSGFSLRSAQLSAVLCWPHPVLPYGDCAASRWLEWSSSCSVSS